MPRKLFLLIFVAESGHYHVLARSIADWEIIINNNKTFPIDKQGIIVKIVAKLSNAITKIEDQDRDLLCLNVANWRQFNGLQVLAIVSAC